MPLHITWQQIAVRLILTLVAGAIIGMNREEKGQPAGLRTTILVCLAASVAMIQVNLLLDLSGKSPTSFIVMDLMRLPLGILSGMGFIGAGAILRRYDMVRGVTTAATLWFVTVMGLCFGGGQLGLGIATLAAGFATVAGLRRFENRLRQNRHAILTIIAEGKESLDLDIRARLRENGFRVDSCSVITTPKESRQELRYEVHWRGRPLDSALPPFYDSLIRHPQISKAEWHL